MEKPDLLEFLNHSPTGFHAINEAEQLLLRNGFLPFDLETIPQINQGYIYKRNSSLCAFILGNEPLNKAGFKITVAHTDSPGFKLKPMTIKNDKGYLTIGLQPYGSPIFATWHDKNLAIAGQAISYKENKYHQRLLNSKESIAVIPNLPIHLNREINTQLSYNPQTQIKAILTPPKKDYYSNPQSLLKNLFHIQEDETVELFLYDNSPAEKIGNEFFTSSQIDDLAMVHAQLTALIHSQESKQATPYTRMITLIDNEEIGSRTYQGACSNFIENLLSYLVLNQTNKQEAIYQAKDNSFLISLDGAHASHPSYPEAFEPDYWTTINQGPVIKYPNNGSYSSDAYSISYIKELAKRANIPLQQSIPRSDKATGSTVGPILASNLGITSIDIGTAMFSMHSSKETAGLQDQEWMIELIEAYFNA